MKRQKEEHHKVFWAPTLKQLTVEACVVSALYTVIDLGFIFFLHFEWNIFSVVFWELLCTIPFGGGYLVFFIANYRHLINRSVIECNARQFLVGFLPLVFTNIFSIVVLIHGLQILLR